MVVLGLKIRGHDTGAALIAGSRIVAIAEERLNRVKHSPNMFPHLSIDYCLDALGVGSDEVDLVVIDQVGQRARTPMELILARECRRAFSRAAVHVINHHDAHAASAFFCSPFAEAAILVWDGAGEEFHTHLGVTGLETETLYRGSENRIFPLQKTLHHRRSKKFLYTFGAGKLYSLFSRKYLGFGYYNEGKMMGLAPYGTDAFLREAPYERWCADVHGHIVCNPHILFPASSPAGRPSLVLAIAKAVARRARDLKKKMAGFVRPRSPKPPPGVQVFSPIVLPRPPRPPAEALPDQYYASVAYAVQRVIERVAAGLGTKLRGATGAKNLCVSGGLGLNIDANRKFVDEAGFERVFVQPGASDTGVPLGCALWGIHVIAGLPRFWVMEHASLGRPYRDDEIVAAIGRAAGRVSVEKPADSAAAVARKIADGAIVGWFSGGSEYGPRALGHRSILCDARRRDMKDILNNRVKHREPWRPFAASVLGERASDYFEFDHESPFMLFAVPVRPERREQVPAIVHVDGTCRIQSVTPASGRYYDLLRAFDALTGTPLLLNTSFNLGGDPIVETPADALECFLKTEMDVLALEDYVVTKKT